MLPAVGVLVSYLAGSIPFAYLAGRVRGIDLRKHGSGNLGATNAIRVLGTPTGMLVYLCDTLKGFLPVFLLPSRTVGDHADLWAIVYGVAAIAGHVRPIFLFGKGGGKGVATTGGVFLALAWLPTVIAAGIFALVVIATRFVSLGSLAAAVALPIGIGFSKGFNSTLFAVSALIGVFVFWAHRANIARLKRGVEPKFGQAKNPATS
jgi:acyl phosphate:glycerol-3-phosphate acyltransferase